MRCDLISLITGMPIKTTTRNQIPPVRMAILTSLQTINAGEGLQETEPTYTAGGNVHRQQPLQRIVTRCQKNLSEELSLRSDMPTPGPGSRDPAVLRSHKYSPFPPVRKYPVWNFAARAVFSLFHRACAPCFSTELTGFSTIKPKSSAFFRHHFLFFAKIFGFCGGFSTSCGFSLGKTACSEIGIFQGSDRCKGRTADAFLLIRSP